MFKLEVELSTVLNVAHLRKLLAQRGFWAWAQITVLHRAAELLVGFVMAALVMSASAAEPLKMVPSEPPSDESSYEARRNRQGVRDEDPNIYVYTQEFAKRFQMPMQWVSDELKGADAVALRVVPAYKTCGWVGDPKACREDEVRCDMDVYFDHNRNPLPWDERMRVAAPDFSTTSLWFLGNVANPFARPAGSLISTYRSPFTEPVTGKELGWQVARLGGAGWTGIRSYDRETFQGISLVTLGVGCHYVPRSAWLASRWIEETDARSGKGVFTYVSFPADWQRRVTQALSDSTQRSNAFFKQQGEKALKALQAQPVPNKAITPIQ